MVTGRFSRETFRKTAGQGSQILFEAAGLAWLREAAASGGAPVVEVLAQGPTWLEEERLVSKAPTRAEARAFGAALARTHAAGAAGMGQAPPGFSGPGWIGRAPLKLFPEASAQVPWGQFYAEYRIRPYLDAGFSARQLEVLERLCVNLESGALDHPQPKLVTSPAARLHGDLWGGNVMWTGAGGVLIDPAAQGGHAEDDLGALSLFGAPHLDQIFAGYDAESPLAPGWQGRLRLHQMHLLVVHAYLFGGHYLAQSVEVAALFAGPADN